MKPYTRQYSIPILLFVFDVATASSTNPLQSRQDNPIQNILPDGTLNCQTESSGDYYGLGVRLGIYFAWFQAWIANVCVPSEISGALDTNTIFLFAILVAMMRCSMTGMLTQLDGLLLMHISGGTVFSALSIWGYRTCTYDVYGPQEGIKRFGGWGTHFRLLLGLAVSTYGFFYWGWGVKGALNGNDFPQCSVVYTFFFTKIRADGGIHILYMIICLLCIIYFGIMLLVSLTVLPTRMKIWRSEQKGGDTGERVRNRFATGLTQRRLRQMFYFFRVGNFIFIIWSMLLIELSLNFNNVAMVLGSRGGIALPSQLIPTIIGAFGFCRVIWVRYREWKAPDYLRSDTKRTILHPNKELVRIYTPKSNVDMEFANHRPDWETDPLMVGQSTWLRFLVSWLPWLAVRQWWKPGHRQNQNQAQLSAQQQPLPPEEEKDVGNTDRPGRVTTWSPNTPKVNPPQQINSWDSDAATASRIGTELPQVPKLSRFGSLR